MMKFETAMRHMDPVQVTDYLHKILDFLKRNSDEQSFPNISQYTEAFLVNLVTDTRNLKYKFLTDEDRKLADEIIELLELTRNVFRWAYSYEDLNSNKNLLVYKKIYTSKVKNRNKSTKRTSSMAHRLVQAQLEPNQIDTLSSRFKLDFLNKTLRFIKNDDETALYYNEMPMSNAEYIQSLMHSPGGGGDVGFGFKSLYSALWEAMEEKSVRFVLKMTLQPTLEPGFATLKLEKRPRQNDSQVMEKQIPKSTEQHTVNVCDKKVETRKTRTRRKKVAKQALANTLDITAMSDLDQIGEVLNHLSPTFIKDTIIDLAQFASDPDRASVTFSALGERELTFVKKVKGWAASPEYRANFPVAYRGLLEVLNTNVVYALNRYKITTVNEIDGSFTIKKTPLFSAPVKKSSASAAGRSKSLVTPKSKSRDRSSSASASGKSKSHATAKSKSRDRSSTKDPLIQFQTASSPINSTIDKSAESTKDTQTRNKENMPQQNVVVTRGAERRGLNKRTAKLLEDMSTPLESDIGKRMMLQMGWDGGALGSRGDGIMEPIIPAVDLSPKAGLGHVSPIQRRAGEFHNAFLMDINDLLRHKDMQRDIVFTEPLTKCEKRIVQGAILHVNTRRASDTPFVTGIVSIDSKTITLIKTVTAENEGTKVGRLCVCVDTRQLPRSKKPAKKQAVRMLFLNHLAEVLHRDAEEVTFTCREAMSTHLMTFVKMVVSGDSLAEIVLSAPELEDYKEFRRRAAPYRLAVIFEDNTNFTLIKKHKKDDDIIEDKVHNNNNEEITDRNKVGNTIKDNKQECNIKENYDNNIVVKDTGRDREIVALRNKVFIIDNSKKLSQDNILNENIQTEKSVNICDNTTNSIQRTDSGVKSILNEKSLTEKSMNIHDNERNGIERTDSDAKNVLTENIKTEKSVNIYDNITNITERTDANVKNNTNSENDNMNKLNNTDTEKYLRDKREIECNSIPNDKENNVVKNINKEIEVFGENFLVLDNDSLSDLDKGIQDLEMVICDADLSLNVKNCFESDSKSALKTEMSCDIKKEDTDSLNNFEDALCFDVKESCVITIPGNKRSRNNFNSSQELGPKRSKISFDENGIIVIISPKSPNDELTRQMVTDVQSVIADEVDKCGAFFPLIRCHCVQNGGLVYSCHDNEDVAWLQNVISVANLDLEITTVHHLHLDNNSKIMAMKINSFLYLDEEKTLTRLELYNVGLHTECWKVLSSQMVSKDLASTFHLFIVEVDEQSFKYISDQNFSLYCGIDKVEFSIIN